MCSVVEQRSVVVVSRCMVETVKINFIQHDEITIKLQSSDPIQPAQQGKKNALRANEREYTQNPIQSNQKQQQQQQDQQATASSSIESKIQIPLTHCHTHTPVTVCV